MSKKAPGMLVVSRGSDGNLDALCRDAASGHCQIRACNVTDSISGRPFNFTTDGIRQGLGLRNSVGLAEELSLGNVWSVENSVDNLERAGQDVHRDNPGEELNFHEYAVRPDGSTGGNYGYSDCLALWSTEGFTDKGTMSTGNQFNATSTTTGGVNDTLCNTERVAPRLTFQAHAAPLDILFSPDGSEALVTFHGSWNRNDPAGYKISSIAFHNGEPKESSRSTTAARDVLSNAVPAECPERCFRPVGLAWDHKERLFMTSDSTGEIYVLVRSETSPTRSGGDATPTFQPNHGTLMESNGLAVIVGMAVTAVFSGSALGGPRYSSDIFTSRLSSSAYVEV